MDTEVGWKEGVRVALSKAQDDGLKLTKVERETGIAAKRLSNFVSSGYLGADEVFALDQYLQASTQPARVNEETVKYYAEMELDFECPHCGEMTPRPRETTDKSPMWCLWCGELLAVACGNCSTLETRRDALFCRVCREPLNWDAVKIRESLNKATETERDRLDRIDKEKETRRRERKKTGEPEL